jgi:predicted nucleic acid-binding protein
MSVGAFVDSNIFLYRNALDDPRHETALQLLRRLLSSHLIVISPQVIGEVFTNLRRDAGADAANSQIRGMLDTCVLQPLDGRTTDSTMRIMDRYGFDFWDSQILAAAIASGARYLITEDLQDGQVIDGVTVVDPFREGFDPDTL